MPNVLLVTQITAKRTSLEEAMDFLELLIEKFSVI